MAGKKVLLYPLEMTVDETAIRLYAIFNSLIYGGTKSLSALKLSKGQIKRTKMLKFLDTLHDKFNGQLLLADSSRSGINYTIERIHSETEIHKPDMVWIDYITLMRTSGKKEEDSWKTVQELSRGVKAIATHHKVVAGCNAQVNREALRDKRIKVPRLENISYGDSIGHDADKVFSIYRNKNLMLYSLVKNRQGPEIPTRRVQFDVDNGRLVEMGVAEEDDD